MAFIFPGQGESHSVGMAQDFYNQFEVARETFEEASQITGVDLKQLIFDGPLETLSKTNYCQIAIYVVSVAILRVIQQQFPTLKPHVVAGLSLGEYTAATAAGILPFSLGVELVFARGTLMQRACEENPSTMAVVLGLSEEQALDVLKAIGRPNDLWLANLNCPGQIVFSGTKSGIEELLVVAKEKGAKRVLPLNVAGAFHSPLMQSAANQLQEKLVGMQLSLPLCKFAMNSSGHIEEDQSNVRKQLINQITQTVRWQSCIEEMRKEGVTKFFEIGPGKVLAGLNKRIKVDGDTYSINSLKDLDVLQNLVTTH
ncbi:MAG: Malonyl CoA-acyl carrier protein transacylase [Chlamydiae bacterium]|nr:Malonyl CoA-acyl carrier protein transacylase [Chlamydiota bacterium]